MTKMFINYSVSGVFGLLLTLSAVKSFGSNLCSGVFSKGEFTAQVQKPLEQREYASQIRRLGLDSYMPIFDQQVPQLIQKLESKEAMLNKQLKTMESDISGKNRLEYNQKKILSKAIRLEIYNLTNRAGVMAGKTTYSQYLDLFVESAVIYDITTRATSSTFEIKKIPLLVKKLQALSNPKHGYLEEMDIEFEFLNSLDSQHRQAEIHVARFYPQVLFVPTLSKIIAADVIRAEAEGIRFIVMGKEKEGLSPLESMSTEQASNIRYAEAMSVIGAAKIAAWRKFNLDVKKKIDDKIISSKKAGMNHAVSESIRGMVAELVYAYLLGEGQIQGQMATLINSGYRFAFLNLDAHLASAILKRHIGENIDKIYFDLEARAKYISINLANPVAHKQLIREGIDALIEIIREVEKENLKTAYAQSEASTAQPATPKP